ncbi:MAG: acyl-CoA desaturase [Pseudobdellovibrionaceae bacterium]|nr:acyl-CoA desaturase [Pseudobdellovibrionaceae bacterium]
MDAFPASVLVFLGAYLLNVLYITVFYHRGLAHEAVILSPRMQRFVAKTGIWVTGIDAKAWVCMHRLHHRHSDTQKDPHSPVFAGVLGLFRKQLLAYRKVLVALIRRHDHYDKVVADLDLEVSAVNARQRWYLPYLSHLVMGVGLAWITGSAWIGAAFVLGISSHPLEGWAVNALAHSYGYRNYATDDNSQNNTWVAWLVAGEGYQNNHHRYPDEARFSHRWFEWDWGYQLCLVLSFCGVLRIAPSTRT